VYRNLAKQADFMQVAAERGRLELCRFLVQACSLFHRDDIINGARGKLYAYAGMVNKSRAIGLVEELHYLLATEYGTSADDGLDYWTDLGEFYGSHRDMDRPRRISQNLMADVPFMERFEIAVDSLDWHPEFFAASFRDHESAMLAAQANKEGKTALHWALEHYGFFRWSSGSGTNDVVVANGYANLAVALIRKGSDVHACWHIGTRLNRSPLISLLQRMGLRWIAAELSDAVYQWGKTIAEAGMSLQKYVATENAFLRTNRCAIRVNNGHEFIVAELEVSSQDRLTLRVVPACEVRV